MIGLISILPHVITVLLIYLAVSIIIQVVKRSMFKSTLILGIENRFNTREKIKKVVSIINIWSFAITISVIILIALFLSNPLERSHIPTTVEAKVDETFIEPTKEEIRISNERRVTEKSLKKKEEAKKDNIAAMKEAENIFK